LLSSFACYLFACPLCLQYGTCLPLSLASRITLTSFSQEIGATPAHWGSCLPGASRPSERGLRTQRTPTMISA
jgi:hypothetical protein